MKRKSGRQVKMHYHHMSCFAEGSEGCNALGEGTVGGLLEGIATTEDVAEDSGASGVGSIDIVIHCWGSISSAGIVGASISGIIRKAIWRSHTCSQNK